MIGILRMGAVLMFIARGYEYIRWGGPYRDIFYHPQGFGGWFSELMNVPLHELLSDPFYENLLNYFSDIVGVLYLGTAFLIGFSNRFVKPFVVVSSVLLFVHYFGLYYHKNLDQIGIVLEHAAQFIIPWAYIWMKNEKTSLAIWSSVIATSITFLAHGLYAMGYYPQPGHFVDMMIIGFGMTEDVARESLTHIGYVDLFFAFVVLFTPFFYDKKVGRSVVMINLWYGVVWGGLTAFARVYTSYTPGMTAHWLDQHLFQTIVRMPHMLLPLYILLYYELGLKRRRK